MNSDEESMIETADMLKILAHPVRLCIVTGLMERGECNVSNMQSCLGTPQSTLSQHLQKLRIAGIIESRRVGVEIYYQVTSEKVRELMEVLFREESN